VKGIFYIVHQDYWDDFRNALVSGARVAVPSGCRAGNLEFTASLLPIFHAYWERNERGGMKAVVLQSEMTDVANYLRQTYPCVPVIVIEITAQLIEQKGGRGYVVEIQERLAADTNGGRIVLSRKACPTASRILYEHAFAEGESGGPTCLSGLA
jgi:hypothetical protein